MKYLYHMYRLDCKSFNYINQFFDYKRLNAFFRKITFLGGATFTISIAILIMIFTMGTVRSIAIASTMALAFSHIPVAIVKKLYPRKRPYLVLENSHVMENPLTDCSFPSGHTPAIFSVITPFILMNPILSVVLLPIGVMVGISRVYLGLHYPSDIIVGSLLGSSSGIICLHFVTGGFVH